ncbi:MAG: coenzyme F420-0:L-glutamate ligase [Actinobacteria bacterium]|nr:coenzyme F420-0:L-glutamate ligase [Actinomycetota bacterium]
MVEAIPIKTKLLMPGDDIVDIAAEYVGDVREDDIVCVAETPLAITQKRFYFLSDLNPSWLARTLCRFFGQRGSLSTAYGMQAATNEVGAVRIVLAFIVGVGGRLVGRRGDFHRIAGKRVSYIDDITGTMPPYDKAIVLCPTNTESITRAIKERLNCEAAVVDANDLGKVNILAATERVDLDNVIKALESNPAGNGDEQTPIVVIRNLDNRQGD